MVNYVIHNTQSNIVSNITDICLLNNNTLIGPDAYISVPGSCDEGCLSNSVTGLNVTPPRKLALYDTWL